MLSVNRPWNMYSQSRIPPLRATSSASATARPQASGMGHSQTFEGSQYKLKAQKLLKLVNDLRDLGAHCSNVDLPTLVVCGNQSAGKSSVMERLSGVQLPRDKGTCTKAPMEVRQSTIGKNWECTIKLRKEFDAHSQRLPAPLEEQFFKVPATHKDKLHLFISAAQKALLNPQQDCKTFAAAAAAQAAAMVNNADSTDSAQAESITRSEQGDSDGSSTQGAIGGLFDESSTDSTSTSAQDTVSAVYASPDALKFTKNVVVLDISGADTDLVLIDLPGIIQSDHSSDSNVDLVRDLVKHYISSERSIIVAVITCKDDIENQQVVQLAREADPQGVRTVGVLTKADTIEEGTHDQWLRVLENKHFPLLLGYYCTVNPTQADLIKQMTHEAAAAKERAFFRDHAAFAAVAENLKSRFGIDALRGALSSQLVKLAETELPKVKHAIEAALAEVKKEVHLLPPAPSSDPLTELLSLLSTMNNKLAQAIDGQGTAMAFFNTIKQHFFEMAASIDKCRPAAWLKAAAPPAMSAGSAAPAADPNQPGYWLRPADDSSGDLMTLNKVQHLSDMYQGEQLPTFAPYKVLDVLVQGSKGRWEPAISSCLEAVAQQLEVLTAELVRDGFQRYPHAESWVWSLLCDKHSTSFETTHKQLSNLLQMELTTTMTLNTLNFEQTKQLIVKMLTEHVCEDDAPALNDGSKQSLVKTLLDTAGIETNAVGLHKMQAENLLERHGRSMDLLNLIAGALTYYQLSSVRMKDNVAYCIKHHLLRSFQQQVEELPRQLLRDLAGAQAQSSSTLSLNSSRVESFATFADDSAAGAVYDSCVANGAGQFGVIPEQLMTEDVGVAQKRAALQSQLDSLVMLRKALISF